MKPTTHPKVLCAAFLLTSLVGSVFFGSIVLADDIVQVDDSFKFKPNSAVKSITINKNLKIHGFQIAPKIYFGRTKVAGKYGAGVVGKRKTWSWGVSTRGISVVKQF